jgi:hypothetical protein
LRLAEPTSFPACNAIETFEIRVGLPNVGAHLTVAGECLPLAGAVR